MINQLEKPFGVLRQLQHLLKYQLERHADIFCDRGSHGSITRGIQ